MILQNLRERCVIKTPKPNRKISPFRVGEKNFSQQIPEPPEGNTFLDLPQNIEPTTIKNRSPK